MNPIEKHRLINEIAFSLVDYKSQDKIRILDDYGVIVSDGELNKLEGVKHVLSSVNEQTLIKIAKHLEISTPYLEVREEKKVTLKKIFISHAVKDQNIVLEFIEILEDIGISEEIIFCSTVPGYGTPLGENFLQEIKDQLNNDVLVLFMLSENFYNDPMCLCEMGAAWVKTKDHIPVVIPPFSFENIEGVFRNTQGITINEKNDLNLFKETLENKYEFTPKSLTKWGRKSDRFLKNINDLIV